MRACEIVRSFVMPEFFKKGEMKKCQPLTN